MTDGSTQVLQTLRSLGCKLIFGIPGIHNLDLYDAMIGSDIQHVTARNEAGAAFMALGHGRSTGKPGVALVITGPGLTNAATAVAQALHDSVPLLIISSQLSRRYVDRDRGELHELRDSTRLAASLCKESRRIPDVEHIDAYLRNAWELATSGRPGPVHVEIPLDLLAPGREAAAAAELAAAAAALQAAKRVGIVAGGGAAAASHELQKLAELLSAPVVMTAAGKGALSDNHPLSLGGRLHMPAVREFLANCDVVLGVGTQLSTTDLWYEPFTVNGSYIALNIDPGHFDVARKADHTLAGDCRTLLPALTAHLQSTTGKDTRKAKPYTLSTEQAQELTEIQQACDAEAAETYGLADEAFKRIQKMLTAVRTALPDTGVLVTDMTTPAYVGLSEYPTRAPFTYLHPVGYGTLGYALPTAIGVKAGSPGLPVVALSGDGGFQFTSSEFAAACDAQLSLPVLIYNDGGYGEIRRTEDLRHPGERLAVDVMGPDLVTFARSFGAEGFSTDDPTAVQGLIEDALKRPYPTIIELRAPRNTGRTMDSSGSNAPHTAHQTTTQETHQ